VDLACKLRSEAWRRQPQFVRAVYACSSSTGFISLYRSPRCVREATFSLVRRHQRRLGVWGVAHGTALAVGLVLPLTCAMRPLVPLPHCQAIHIPVVSLDCVPGGLWRKLQFYASVLLRGAMLFSIVVPLALTYPLSSLHPRVQAIWLSLFQLSLRWCGPAFTKWGQWASARGDLLPHDVRSVLETLQSKAPSQPPKYTIETLHRSLPLPFDEVFESFEMEPIGSGAIAEVHRARLTPAAAAMCGISAEQV
jgi:hypothetical protein